MASVAWMQGCLLSALRDSEFCHSHPEKMVYDRSEVSRVVFCMSHLGRPPSDPIQAARQQPWRDSCKAILNLASALLKKMKR